MYRFLVRPFVRKMSPDRASRFALEYYRLLGKIPGWRFISRLLHKNRPLGLEREVFGLQFYNPLGLGAGLDRKGTLYNDLNDLGFSFVEIGPLDASGVRETIKNIGADPQNDILGICIASDFLTAFTLAYDFGDFFVLDFSENQPIETLDPVLEARLTYEKYKPIVLKLPKSAGDRESKYAADYCMMNGVDGIEARTLSQIKAVSAISSGRLPIIANCGIKTPQEAAEMLEAGASLVEIRSGFVKEGSSIVSKMLNYLESVKKNEGKTLKTDAPGNAGDAPQG